MKSKALKMDGEACAMDGSFVLQGDDMHSRKRTMIGQRSSALSETCPRERGHGTQAGVSVGLRPASVIY